MKKKKKNFVIPISSTHSPFWHENARGKKQHQSNHVPNFGPIDVFPLAFFNPFCVLTSMFFFPSPFPAHAAMLKTIQTQESIRNQTNNNSNSSSNNTSGPFAPVSTFTSTATGLLPAVAAPGPEAAAPAALPAGALPAGVRETITIHRAPLLPPPIPGRKRPQPPRRMPQPVSIPGRLILREYPDLVATTPLAEEMAPMLPLPVGIATGHQAP